MKFVSLWINKDSDNHTLPPMIEICLRSFVRHGHEFYLFSYDSKLEVPPGIKLCNANEIMELDNVMINARYKIPNSNNVQCSIANFSDRFRWKTLKTFPHMCWADTDIYLLKHVPPMEKYLTNGNISAVKYNNSEFFKILYDYATNPCTILPFDSKESIDFKNKVASMSTSDENARLHFSWGYAGCDVVGKLMDHLNIESNDMEWFYPFSYGEFRKIFFNDYNDKKLTEIFPNTYGIHLWNGMIIKYNWPIKCIKNSIFYKIIYDNDKKEDLQK